MELASGKLPNDCEHFRTQLADCPDELNRMRNTSAECEDCRPGEEGEDEQSCFEYENDHEGKGKGLCSLRNRLLHGRPRLPQAEGLAWV